MSNRGVSYLADEIYKIINYACLEFNLTFAEAVGVLELAKFDLIKAQSEEEENEEEVG